MTPAVPGWPGVAASAGLAAVAVGIAARARIGLAREMAVASVRTAVQLVAVGAVLAALFGHGGVAGAVGWMGVMVVIGGRVAARRGRGVPHAPAVATAGLLCGTAATMATLVACGVVATKASVLVPVAGMIVTGSMQACGLVLIRLREEATAARPAVEARLSLGLTAAEAFAPSRRVALRTALVPSVDSMKVVGLITLPGAMTGLILAGVDPLTAIRYQIVVMYMQLASGAIAALVTTRLAQAALFDDADRLRE